jgi:hypothetical protein
MPGGKLHKPIWSPYAIYCTVDYFYGWPAFEAHDGFTAAQSIMNIVETVMYSVYLWIVYTYGFRESDKSGRGTSNVVLGKRKVVGKEAGLAVLIVWSAAVMTVSKTSIYGKCFHLNETGVFQGVQNTHGLQSSMKLVPDFRTLATTIGTLCVGHGSYQS